MNRKPGSKSTEEEVLNEMARETLADPEEVLLRHNNRFIAHRRYGKGVI